ncbi:MAG: alpha/beta fold hydrolase [Saprospiraceae bacterium]|nr:alpha/beta fold hydrolase [Saprospiraceae bacterium]
MRFSKKLLAFTLLCTCAAQIFAQELPRRAFFGVRMETLTEEGARILKLPAAKGVLLNNIVPGSTAEAAGLQRGDVWFTLNDREINSPAEGVEALKQLREGQSFTYTYLRQGTLHSEKAVAKAYPREQYPDFDIEYGSVKVNDDRMRSICTRPRKSGKLPAVLFIQGVGCYSLDTPLDTSSVEVQLLNNLTRNGFVTFRVDKPGQGDSQGGPCSSVDFEEEADVYRQALLQLRKMEGVDPDRIFIIGHSMGGVFAPIIAQDAPVRGIIAYGTIGSNFMEYFVNSRRTIAQAYGMSPAETDNYVKLHCECLLPYIADGLPMEQIAALKPQCANIVGSMGRDNPFWQQLYGVNLPALWSDYSGQVLAIWGKSDYVSTRSEHQWIADVVNRAHPGKGSFVELDQCDHGMHIATSFQQAAQGQTTGFNPLVLQTIREWLIRHANV